MEASSKDCPTDIFDCKTTHEKGILKGRWNRRLVLRREEPEYFQTHQSTEKELEPEEPGVHNANTGQDGDELGKLSKRCN